MKILLDCDDVLTQSTAGFITALEACGHVPEKGSWQLFTEHSVKDVKRYISDRPGWCYDLPLKDGVVEALATLRGFGTCVAVTAPFKGVIPWYEERRRALEDKMGFCDATMLFCHGTAKPHVLGDVFVDDNPDTVRAWASAHPKGAGIFWEAPWARGKEIEGRFNMYRVSTWETVLEIVKELKV